MQDRPQPQFIKRRECQIVRNAHSTHTTDVWPLVEGHATVHQLRMYTSQAKHLLYAPLCRSGTTLVFCELCMGCVRKACIYVFLVHRCMKVPSSDRSDAFLHCTAQHCPCIYVRLCNFPNTWKERVQNAHKIRLMTFCLWIFFSVQKCVCWQVHICHVADACIWCTVHKDSVNCNFWSSAVPVSPDTFDDMSITGFHRMCLKRCYAIVNAGNAA